MNITKVAAWSEIVSSVAVLATLVYLALQVQQNTAAIYAQSRQAMIDGDLQILADVKNNPGIFLDYVAEGELSPRRKMRLHASLLATMRTRESHWFQYKNGVLDEVAWRSYQSAIPNILGTERTRAWWAIIGHRAFNAKFVDEVNKMLETMPYTDAWEQVLALK